MRWPVASQRRSAPMRAGMPSVRSVMSPRVSTRPRSRSEPIQADRRWYLVARTVSAGGADLRSAPLACRQGRRRLSMLPLFSSAGCDEGSCTCPQTGRPARVGRNQPAPCEKQPSHENADRPAMMAVDRSPQVELLRPVTVWPRSTTEPGWRRGTFRYLREPWVERPSIFDLSDGRESKFVEAAPALGRRRFRTGRHRRRRLRRGDLRRAAAAKQPLILGGDAPNGISQPWAVDSRGSEGPKI